MLTFEQIKELVELVASHRLHSLEIDRSGFQLKIQGEASMPTAPAVVVAPATAPAPPVVAEVRPAAVAAAPSAAAPPSAPPAAEAGAGVHVVTSPIVGTFYASPSPMPTPSCDPATGFARDRCCASSRR